jgi:hypothetical protein
MKQVARVVECHDHHHEPAHDINAVDPFHLMMFTWLVQDPAHCVPLAIEVALKRFLCYF